MTDLKLAGEFPPARREDWLKLVEQALKGAPLDETLVARTYDGLRIEALSERAAEAHAIAGARGAAPWQVLQRVDHPDPAKANAQALEDLANGANELALVLAGSIGSHGYGIDGSEATLGRVLDGVYLDAGIAIEFDLSPQNKDAAAALTSIVKTRGIAPSATNIRFGFDPLGAIAQVGASPLPWSALSKLFTAAVTGMVGQGFRGPFAVADGRVIHNAGGSEAQELAFALALAVEYMRALESSGIKLDDARRMIFFRMAADADQFLTIAKFRALRKLWARVEEACDLAPRPIFISAETAWRMMTKRDPYVNMLRATVAVFSAGLGGADSVTVLPYTAPLGLPDAFARRVARNTQFVLIEEANVHRVADAGAGSGAIENLTQELCAAAWRLFQGIEASGGAAEALVLGVIQRAVEGVRKERESSVARRIEALTGTSEFPAMEEKPPAVLDVPRPKVPPLDVAAKLASMPPMRLAEPFEELRDASDRYLAKTGARPKIFLANLGSPADFIARAAFAKNLFEAGGIEVAGNDGFASTAALSEAFKQSGARIACLCSSDKRYAVEAEAAAKALKQAGASHVLLAGEPGSHEKKWRAAGVDEFTHEGCDALAILRNVHATFTGATAARGERT